MQKQLIVIITTVILVTRASSMTETDSQIKYDRQLSKSRPRPGTSTSSASNSLIAPPPSSRKNSSANDTPDLISFSSPPTSQNDIIEFCNQQRLVICKLDLRIIYNSFCINLILEIIISIITDIRRYFLLF